MLWCIWVIVQCCYKNRLMKPLKWNLSIELFEYYILLRLFCNGYCDTNYKYAFEDKKKIPLKHLHCKSSRILYNNINRFIHRSKCQFAYLSDIQTFVLFNDIRVEINNIIHSWLDYMYMHKMVHSFDMV